MGGRPHRVHQPCGGTPFPQPVPGSQPAAARGHARGAPRARPPGLAPPRPARRPRPRRRNQEVVTCGGADWLPAAGIAAAGKLRRRAASARAQCLPRLAALRRLGVRPFSAARRRCPAACSLGRPQRGTGGRTRSGCCGTPGLCAADARHQRPAAQTVAPRSSRLRLRLVFSRRLRPVRSLCGSRALRWEREARAAWSS